MNKIEKLLRVGWIKSIWLNFYCLPFKQAIRFPIIVSRNTKVHVADRSCISIMGMGTLRIGFLGRKLAHDRCSTMSIDGKLVIKGDGHHSFAPGLNLFIPKGGIMVIGDNFSCMQNATIQAYKKITIGDDNLWSFDNVVMDSDTHLIFDKMGGGEMISHNRDVSFGNHIWLGCRNIVLKGANIPSGCIVAAGSTITSEVYPENAIISSKGKVIKEGIDWSRELNFEK